MCLVTLFTNKMNKMAEEDAELKELVIQSLENTGVLAKIRAQLRASVFLALDDANTLQKKKPLANNELQNYLSTRTGEVVGNLFREFLLHFHLDSTLSVYESESQFGHSYSSRDRHSLCRDLGLNSNEIPVKGPLIDAVVSKHIVQPGAADEDVRLTSAASDEPKSNSTVDAEEGSLDPFFDDPVPNEENALPLKPTKQGPFSARIEEAEQVLKERDAKAPEEGEKSSDENLKPPIGSQNSTFTISPLGFLKDAPPLIGPSKLPPLWSESKTTTITKSGAQDDDYEEDFQSSASFRSDQKSGTEHSIEEDIEENFSGVVDDLFSNEGVSEGDDVTTDHTISHISTTGADYLESIG